MDTLTQQIKQSTKRLTFTQFTSAAKLQMKLWCEVCQGIHIFNLKELNECSRRVCTNKSVYDPNSKWHFMRTTEPEGSVTFAITSLNVANEIENTPFPPYKYLYTLRPIIEIPTMTFCWWGIHGMISHLDRHTMRYMKKLVKNINARLTPWGNQRHEQETTLPTPLTSGVVTIFARHPSILKAFRKAIKTCKVTSFDWREIDKTVRLKIKSD